MSEPKDIPFIRESLSTVAQGKVVLDVGGGEPFGKWMKHFKYLFEECEYKSFDYDSSTGADVVGDIHAIPLADNAVDGIICSSVLEHVRDPLKAMSELHRVLKPGGAMFFYVPSTYPYHARSGHYPDYWRFFSDTIDELFKDFSSKKVHKRGGYFRALSFFVPKQHAFRWFLDPVADSLDDLFRTDKRSTTAGWYVLGIK